MSLTVTFSTGSMSLKAMAMRSRSMADQRRQNQHQGLLKLQEQRMARLEVAPRVHHLFDRTVRLGSHHSECRDPTGPTAKEVLHHIDQTKDKHGQPRGVQCSGSHRHPSSSRINRGLTKMEDVCLLLTQMRTHLSDHQCSKTTSHFKINLYALPHQKLSTHLFNHDLLLKHKEQQTPQQTQEHPMADLL
jgi:hypothetical protein